MDIQLRIFKNVWAYVLSSFSRLQVELELKGTSEHLAFEETKSGFSWIQTFISLTSTIGMVSDRFKKKNHYWFCIQSENKGKKD